MGMQLLKDKQFVVLLQNFAASLNLNYIITLHFCFFFPVAEHLNSPRFKLLQNEEKKCVQNDDIPTCSSSIRVDLASQGL